MNPKLTYVITTLLLIITNSLFAQVENNYWSETPLATFNQIQEQFISPNVYRAVSLQKNAFLSTIVNAPKEENTDVKNSSTIIQIPMPDGEMEEFRIVEYSMMEAGLAAQFPDIKTFRGVGKKNPYNSIRFDWTTFGLRGVVHTAEGVAYIEPYSKSSTTEYMSFWKTDLMPTDNYECHSMAELSEEELENDGHNHGVEKAGDCNFRSFRLAVATTGEYSNFHGAFNSGGVGTVLSAVTTTINRVNDIYERDFGIRLILVANTTNVFYYSPSTDPYTNNSGVSMLSENMTTLFNNIGTNNYDIGHVFSTNGGGVATLESPCNSGGAATTEFKARGVTGTNSPTGDGFDIDYVCHEMGHQFGAHHTFNNSCSGNRSDASAYEPGSGTTIMAYAGVCPPNVQFNTGAYFHTESIREVREFITTGGGSSCAQLITTNNTPPTADAGADYYIPRSTPFILSGTGSDADGDALTYSWEQWDNEISQQAPLSTSTSGPNFRSFLPTTSGVRYIPQISDVISNTSPTWEVLSSVSRNFEFRLTVRDNSTNMAGCTAEDEMMVSVAGTAGPFVLTYPNTSGITWSEGDVRTITWNVANTNLAPINCSLVDIYLSKDGGYTYPTMLASSVPNTGSAEITVPVGTTTVGRIMLKANGNIFYDISNQNMTIQAGSPSFSLAVLSPVQSVCAPNDAVYTVDVESISGYNENVLLSLTNAPANSTASFSPNPVTPGSSATLTISNISNVAIGDYSLTLNGSTSGLSKGLGLTLNVSPLPSSVIQTSPSNNAEGLSLTPTFTWNTSANAVAYEIEISTTPAFSTTTVSTTTTGTTYSVASPLETGTTYFWRVRGTSYCGGGNWSSILRFKTVACVTFSNTNTTNINQGSGASATTYSTIDVLNTGEITDVDVLNIKGTHTWVSDLTTSLISPTGTEVKLWEALCGSGDDFDVSFDDESTEAYSGIACGPLGRTGSYQPSESLSVIDGEDINGTWQLKIFDSYNGDGGDLLEWSLFVCFLDAFSSNDSQPLPVNWLSFDAKAKGDYIQLDWEVSQEINNVGYEVERKNKNTEFEKIGFVEMQNNSSIETNKYKFEDRTAEKGIVYQYRIRQIDASGQAYYSQVKEANILAERPVVQLFPNPVSDYLTITIFGENTFPALIQIFDVRGRKVMQAELPENNVLSIGHLAAGVYMIEINLKGYSEMKKIVVE